METIEEKYKAIRPLLKHGDLILFHGTGIVAKIIQKCDTAFWNHIGVILKINGAFFIVDANANGVQADRLSWRISKYKRGGDFMIIQSKLNKKEKFPTLEKLLQKSDGNWIKYDYINGVKELLNRKFKLSLNITVNDNRDICSDYVSRYAIEMRMVDNDFLKLKIAFPEDYLCHADFNNVTIIE